MHIIEALREANDSLHHTHLSHPITVRYGCCRFYAGYLNSNLFNAYKHRSTTRTRMSFSAEPGRTAGYSRDIGWRVIRQKVGMGLTFRQVAFRLQIAVSTAHRIFVRFRDTGDLSHTSNRKLDELHELYILGMTTLGCI